MDETLHRAVTNSGIVIPPARQRTLSPPLRSLHRRILRHFADRATAPAPRLLGEWAHDLDVSLDTALDQLVADDPSTPARTRSAPSPAVTPYRLPAARLCRPTVPLTRSAYPACLAAM
jgi:hypothetical protein